MSSRVEIHIKAVDEASKTIAQVGQTTEEAIKRVEEANQGVERASREASGSVRDLITGFSGLATSAFALYSAVDKVQDMQVTLSRANLQVQTSLNAVEDAQRRYNAAVEKYGIDSEKARAALADLQIAQERYQVAVERATVIQGNINEAMVQSALMVVPTLITAVDSGIKAFTNLEAGVKAVNTAMAFLAANPVVAVIMAVGVLITVLVTAYQTCEPFRNAVNALGAALMNTLKPAIEAIINALTWLWNNVIKPVADAFGWFVGVIKGAFQALTGATETARVEASQDIQEIRTQAVSMGETVRVYSAQAASSVQGFASTVKASESAASTSFQNIAKSAQNMADEVYRGYTKVADGVYVATDALKRAAEEAAKAIGKVWDEYEAKLEKAHETQAGGGKATSSWPGQPTGKQYGSLGGTPAQSTPTATTSPPFKLEPVQTIGGLTVMRLVEGQYGFEGLVGRPTLFLAGEAGPEYVSIRPEGRGAGVNIRGPLIHIEGSADEKTVAKAVKELERILRSIILENTSSNAPDWSKRIRFGGVW